jgi:hypothetical protein
MTIYPDTDLKACDFILFGFRRPTLIYLQYLRKNIGKDSLVVVTTGLIHFIPILIRINSVEEELAQLIKALNMHLSFLQSNKLNYASYF